MMGGALAMEGPATVPAATPIPAEYQRSDANFYPKGDVVRANPTAIIIPVGGYSQKGDSYVFTPRKKAPKEMYVETLNDWIEPITPPDMPASLGVPPDAMQIREPRGDVQAALPSAPANFSPVTDGMTLPNGAVVKTGVDGTAAVLFGGVESARLIPNSEAAVQQTVTAQSRSAEVDLTTGGVFSKVGSQVGVKVNYEVHTPFGNAVAHGTDFVTITTSARTDIWVAQGTVELDQPDGKKAGVVTSDGAGPLKIIRFPGIADPHLVLPADAETLTTVLNFIPLANQKIKALRDKKANGATLTTNEQAYLHRIKQVPALIKLALVEPPTPTPAPPVASAPATAPAPSSPANVKPLNVVVHPDGTVRFKGATIGLAQFQSKLETVIKAAPDQAIVIKAGESVPQEKIKAVLDICVTVQVKNVSVAASAAAPTPTPAPAPAPASAPTPTPAPPVTSAPAEAPAPPSPANPKSLRAVVRIDGKINFQGNTYELPGFKSKLEALMKATPDQPIAIKAGKKVSYEHFKAVMDVCQSAQVKNVSVIPPAPTPPPPDAPAAAESATTNLPAPGLLLHPSIESTSSNAPPVSPSGLPTPTPSPSTPGTPAESAPTTNAPAPASP